MNIYRNKKYIRIILSGFLMIAVGSASYAFALDKIEGSQETVASNPSQKINTNLKMSRPNSVLANQGFLKIFQGVSNITLGWEPNSSFIYEFPDKSVSVNQENQTQMVYFYKNFNVSSLSITIENDKVSVEQLGPRKFKFKRKKINTSGTERIRPNIDYVYNAELWLGGPLHAGGPQLQERFTGISEHFTNSSGISGNEDFNVNLEPTPELILDKKTAIKNIEVGSDFKQTATDFFTVKQSAGKVSSEITRLPDFSQVGKTSLTIKVWDEYNSAQTFTVPFNVVDSRVLSADVVPQDILLGEKIGSINLNKSIQNVKLGSKTLNTDDYDIKIDDSDDTNKFQVVGTQEYSATIKEKLTGKLLKVKLPFNITWGSTIYLKGGLERSIGAITLHTKGEKILLTDTVGSGGTSTFINYSFKGKLYYSLSLLEVSDSPKHLDRLNSSILTQGQGDSMTDQKIRGFGGNGDAQQLAEVGNIIKVLHKEASTNERLIVNGQETKENNDSETVYYELTKNGFQPLRVNQLMPKTGTLPLYASKQYLDEHISEYIDLKGYKNIEVKNFSVYPMTNNSGNTSGKIIVEETLRSGKKVQWEYEVPFTILEGTLDLSVPQTMSFKDFNPSKFEQIIQRKVSNNLGLVIKDTRSSGSQGNWTLTAKVADSSGIAPYLVYRDTKGSDKYLTDAAVPIHTQDKVQSSSGPLEVEVSDKWSNNTGILLKVPPKNNLINKVYSTAITWNLVEGPY